MKINIGKATLDILRGDITDQDTDAIVNAANNYLWMGAGVAGSIKRKGGQIIEDEAVDQGPIDVGNAVITTAGDLPAKCVIHAAGMGQDLKTNEKIIRQVTMNSFLLAEDNGLFSISFPAIGTGVGGFEIHHCAKVMLEETIDYLIKSKKIKEVRFVLFDQSSFEAFDNQLRKMFSS